ncbi:MAG TPA: hypothetical protein VFE36_13095 [Candidatus Baltobacteraceae bacterium]|jgi:hypothetical protein|nr:hypothetical protein [Candidatus Baltobacteraceae bacterium]
MDQERFESPEIDDDGGGVVQRLADNPMLMLLGGLAVGFLIGMVVPVSRFEQESLGPVAGDLKDRMREAGTQAARRGTEAIKESIETATASDY